MAQPQISKQDYHVKRFSSGQVVQNALGSSTDQNSKPKNRRHESASSLSKYSLGSDEGKIVEVADDFENSDDEEERKDDGRAPEIILPNLSEEEEIVRWSMLSGNKLNKD